MKEKGLSMKGHWTLDIPTHGERFYLLTDLVRESLAQRLEGAPACGVLTIFCQHTSCALLLAEAYEDSAVADMQEFLRRLAPRNLEYLTHKTEGPDDSPSHMKSIVLRPSLQLIVEDGKPLLGGWQGIFLAEFRDAPRKRQLWLKFQADA